ncbi:hypothetical protein ACH5RR_002829 [Cinchona calisaya]|uniref:Uncharacterized protein n=1 Tax=Cinchona calisaya TaxID=153742 RepID=A0ABD3AT32_9GENT
MFKATDTALYDEWAPELLEVALKLLVRASCFKGMLSPSSGVALLLFWLDLGFKALTPKELAIEVAAAEIVARARTTGFSLRPQLSIGVKDGPGQDVAIKTLISSQPEALIKAVVG